MDNYIKTVSLTYNSTNVKPSTILSYFFRMIGTYTQENVIDVSKKTYFPQNSCINIFLISKPKDLEFINQNCQNVLIYKKIVTKLCYYIFFYIFTI